jgi:hypothetical protein
MAPVSLSASEFQELLWLIDDEPVNEVHLRGIRRKLARKYKLLRAEIRKNQTTDEQVG